MSRRGAVLENYQAPPYLDTRQGIEMQKLTDDAIQHMATLTAQAAMQGQKEKGDDQWRKLKMVDDATDPSKYQSPGLKSNSAVSQMLLDIKKEALSSKDPIDKIYLGLQNRLTPLAQGFNTYKDNLAEQDKLVNEAVKVNPNLDLEKLKIDLQKKVDDEFLTTKPDGSLDFNQARFGTKSNALTDLLNPDNAWKYSKGTKSLYEAIQKGGDKGELFQKAPDGSQINHTTNIPFWGELVDGNTGNPLSPNPNTGLIDKGAKPILKVKGTPLDYQQTDKDGNPMVDKAGKPIMKTMYVVPQKTMDAILFNDELKYQFEADFQKHNQMSGAKIPPEQIDEMKRIHLSKILAENGLPQPYVSSITHLPPQPRNITNNNINMGGQQTPTVDIFGEIFDKTGSGDRVKNGKGYPLNGLSGTAQKIVLQYAKDITNNKDLNYGDIYVKQTPDGRVVVVDAKTNADISPINALDINKEANKDLNKTWSSKSEEKAAKNINLKGTEKQQTTGIKGQSGNYTNIQTLQDAKGKSIQAGVKNGKWYDVKTGKPIE